MYLQTVVVFKYSGVGSLCLIKNKKFHCVFSRLKNCRNMCFVAYMHQKIFFTMFSCFFVIKNTSGTLFLLDNGDNAVHFWSWFWVGGYLKCMHSLNFY